MNARRRNATALLGALALVGVACGGAGSAGYDTVNDPDKRTIFEIPQEWNIYQADALVQLEGVPFIPELGFPATETYVAFDGAAGADLSNLTVPITDASFPIGAQVIRTITPDEKDVLSRQIMVASTYDFTAVQGLEAVQSEDFSFGDDFDGIRGLYGLTNDDGEQEAAIYVIAVTNPDVTVMYSMAIGCSITCFNTRGEEIIKAVDSWLVNTRP